MFETDVIEVSLFLFLCFFDSFISILDLDFSDKFIDERRGNRAMWKAIVRILTGH